MNTTFTVAGGYDIEIRSDGRFSTRDPQCASGGQATGQVSFQVHMQYQDTKAWESLACITLTPSRARAIASALLTAAQEAKELR